MVHGLAGRSGQHPVLYVSNAPALVLWSIPPVQGTDKTGSEAKSTAETASRGMEQVY